MAGGFSANQRVFGTEMGIPDSLICPSQCSASIYEGPLEQMRNAHAMRQAATRAWATMDNRERLLRASRAKHRVPMSQLVVGQYVYLWRQPNHGRGAWLGSSGTTPPYWGIYETQSDARRRGCRRDVEKRNFKSDKVGLRKFHDVTNDTSPVLARQWESVQQLDVAVLEDMEAEIMQRCPPSGTTEHGFQAQEIILPMPESLHGRDVCDSAEGDIGLHGRDVHDSAVVVCLIWQIVVFVCMIVKCMTLDMREICMDIGHEGSPVSHQNMKEVNRQGQGQDPGKSAVGSGLEQQDVHNVEVHVEAVPAQSFADKGKSANSETLRSWNEMTEPTEPPWRRRRRAQEAQETTPLFRGAASLRSTPNTPPPRHFIGHVQSSQEKHSSRVRVQQGIAASWVVEKGIVKAEQLSEALAKLFGKSRAKEAVTVQPSMEQDC
eukprot:2302665-Amphidinium_carterae.3